jgi:hypothetical protein
MSSCLQKLSAGSGLFPTEMLHGLYDGGAGAGLNEYWDAILKSKAGGGGFIWAFLDEDVKRVDKGGILDSRQPGPDGIVGPYREREGSFYTVKQLWSPIIVTPPAGTSRSYTVTNRYSFLNADQCTFEWETIAFRRPNDARPPDRWSWHRGLITAVRWRRAPRQAGTVGDRLLLLGRSAKKDSPMPLGSVLRTHRPCDSDLCLAQSNGLASELDQVAQPAGGAKPLRTSPATHSLRRRVTCRCRSARSPGCWSLPLGRASPSPWSTARASWRWVPRLLRPRAATAGSAASRRLPCA